MSIISMISAAIIGGLIAASSPASATTCSSLLTPHNASGTTAFSMSFTATDGRFAGWMSLGGSRPTLSSDGTYLIATGLNQVFSDRRTTVCGGDLGLCLPFQPFDLNQSGNGFEVFIRLTDAALWVWNGSNWEGPFAPINNCNTGMLYYAGTDYGFGGMYQIGLGPLVPPVVIR